MKITFSARLLEHLRRLQSAARGQAARATGAQIGPGCRIGSGCDLALGLAAPRQGRLEIGAECELGPGVLLHPYGGSLVIARHVHIGQGTVIYGHGGVTIGEDTLIAMHCRILSSNHTVPAFGTAIRSQPDLLLPTKIGRDVWLGAGVTILGGVTLGDGCVVGAGAVVTKDLPPGAIAHGVPAQVRGIREGSPRP